MDMVNDKKDIRWRQRFENFERSYLLLLKYSKKVDKTELERAGVIQLFEMTFELAWKLMKDYLEAQEIYVKSPREAIKQAFQMELLEDGHIWMDALADRNRTVHTYDEAVAKKMMKDISGVYTQQLTIFYTNLKKEI